MKIRPLVAAPTIAALLGFFSQLFPSGNGETITKIPIVSAILGAIIFGAIGVIFGLLFELGLLAKTMRGSGSKNRDREQTPQAWPPPIQSQRSDNSGSDLSIPTLPTNPTRRESPQNSSRLPAPPKTQRRKPTRKQKRALKNSQHQVLLAEQNLSATRAVAALFEDNVRQVEPRQLSRSTETEIIRATNCTLIEVRKGARVSVRNTSHSSSGSSSSARLGGLSVGGSSRHGSSTSTSVNFPAPDQLQRIDTGTAIISTTRISFAGTKFSRSTPFTKIVLIESEGSSLLIASSTSSKVWICKFGSGVDHMIATSIISALLHTSSPSRDKADVYRELIEMQRAYIAERVAEATSNSEETKLLHSQLSVEV